MSKLSALLFLVSLKLIYHPVLQNDIPAFSNYHPMTKTLSGVTGARVTSFKANIENNRVYLTWAVSENEKVDIFEIERTEDGRNFKTTALVFGTDKAQTAIYQFYEQARNPKFRYRIKIINKDKKTAYSQVVKITPFS